MQKTRTILGLDPGLRHTGWGIIQQTGNQLSFIACGTIHTNAKESTAERLAHIYTGLQGVVDEYRPTDAAVEEVFVNTNARTSLQLGQARGMCLLVPQLAGVAVGEYTPTQVKKAIVGTGRAEKAQIAFMVQTLLPKAKPNSEDAADALAVAICHGHTV